MLLRAAAAGAADGAEALIDLIKVTNCQRSSAGRAAHEGIPFSSPPLVMYQKIAPSGTPCNAP